MEFPIRINKYLAEKGFSTRRGADALILKGVVFVNGKKAVIGQQVVDGDIVDVREKQKEYRYVLYYKPRGIITHSPGAGETDIEARIKKDFGLAGLFPVGRLDKDSEGLVMLTDDGRITDRLLNPKYMHKRTYEVTVDKPITSSFLVHMKHGVDIEGYVTKPADIEKVTNDRFLITLTEGKKHQIRRMCAAQGYQIKVLKRVNILTLTLGGLKSGQYRTLQGTELDTFLSGINL